VAYLGEVSEKSMGNAHEDASEAKKAQLTQLFNCRSEFWSCKTGFQR
jgi:hypothetical protein